MATPRGTIRVCQDCRTVTFQVVGWGRMYQSMPLRRLGEKLLTEGIDSFRVDLRHCTYIDSTFLGTLLTLKRVSKKGNQAQFVLVSPEIWRLAVDACQGQSQVWKCAVAICRFIHTEFKYEQFSTDVHTGSSEVLELRRGVCQDFAHVMIGMCRAWKIPARYVSGYLYNGPADHLTGAQASHAWCEVYLPGLGWRALDPTNNQPADERYIRLAVGRDYADVAPIKGYYKGTKDKRMQVEVSVELLQR